MLSLHFNLIIAFQTQRARVQYDNNQKYVTVQ
uniref:Uncharacterized protein n=1 Tax=Anguilla anguilla TaxID=7936 RepID=A0A0E9WHM2_ANGAN